jgi:hypothetical protein
MTRIGCAAAVVTLAIALAPPARAQQATPTAPPPAVGLGSAQGQPTPAAAPPAMGYDTYRNGPQGFSVVLVLGDMQTASTADSVPAAARKALADMKDFLPYKGYRLLDVQWTLCCGRNPVISRLRGADEQEYELELTPTVSPNFSQPTQPRAAVPVVSVRFVLREPVASAADAEVRTSALEARIADLRRKQADLEKTQGTRNPEVLATAAQIRSLQQELTEGQHAIRRPGSTRAVIDTSFRMDVGETVVVGTSRVKGGEKALIALLTAVPQKTTSTK